MINETPVRTSKNFEINEYRNEIILPNKVILSGKSNVKLDNFITNKVDNIANIKYGIGDKVRDFYLKNINNKISITSTKTNAEFNISNELKENDILCDYINIDISKDTDCKGVILYSSIKAEHFGFININAEENAKGNIVIVNDLGANSNSYLTIQANTNNYADIKFIVIDFAGKTSINSYYVNLQGEKANADIDLLYFGNNEGNLDYNLLNEVYGQKCTTSINAIGALQNNAKKDFKGTINLIKGCIGSFGRENETCLLLSNTARAKSLPMLLCTEENIEGGEHSSSVGKIDEKTIFYIMTRGLSEKEAIKLAVRASLSTIVDKIYDEKIVNLVQDRIDMRLEEDE